MIRELAKLDLLTIEKNAEIIKILLLRSIIGRGSITQPNQKACNLYIFRKNILLVVKSFLQNTKNSFCFREIDLLVIP